MPSKQVVLQFDYAPEQQVLNRVHNPTKLGVRTDGPYTIEHVNINGNLTIIHFRVLLKVSTYTGFYPTVDNFKLRDPVFDLFHSTKPSEDNLTRISCTQGLFEFLPCVSFLHLIILRKKQVEFLGQFSCLFNSWQSEPHHGGEEGPTHS